MTIRPSLFKLDLAYLIETFAWHFNAQQQTALSIDGSCQNTHFSNVHLSPDHLLISRSMHPCQLLSDHSANCSPFPAPGHRAYLRSLGRSVGSLNRDRDPCRSHEGDRGRHGSRHNAVSHAAAHSAAGIRYHLRSRSTLSCLVNHLRRSLRKQAVPRRASSTITRRLFSRYSRFTKDKQLQNRFHLMVHSCLKLG